MLAKIKKLIKKKGLMAVALDLGYRSEGTVRKWVKANKIPHIAVQKVEAYLASQNA